MFVVPVSTWVQANSWANAQASAIQQVITEQVSATASLAGAQSDYLLGTAGLAANAAAKRLQAERKPESAALQTLIGAAGMVLNRLV